MGLLFVITIGIIVYSTFLKKYLISNNIKISKWFIIGLYIFAYYLGVVFEITGPGNIFDIGRDMNMIINLVPFKDIIAGSDFMMNLFQLTANIILFIPLGILLPSLFERFEKFHNTLLMGFILSLIIEIFQLLNVRATDINDLLMNTLGTVIGFIIYSLLLKKFTSKLKLKNRNNGETLIKYNSEFFISIMFYLYFFITPCADRILNKLIFRI